MITDILLSTAQELGLTADAANASIYGVYKGFGVCVKAIPEKSCFMLNAWARKGALTNKSAQDWLAEYAAKPENSWLKAFKAQEYGVSAIIFAEDEPKKDGERLHGFIYDLITYFSMNYYSNSCAKCGSAIGLSFEHGSNGYIQLCKMCCEKEPDTSLQTQQMPQAQPMAAQQAAAGAAMAGAAAFQGGTMAGVNPIPTVNPAPAQYGMPAMQAGGVAPTDPSAQSEVIQNAPDTMDSINPATAPESTGFATAESVAKIPMPIQSGMAPDYSPTPIPNDFRADPAYTNAPPVYTPIRPTTLSGPANSNPILGFLGALLFSLIACVVWVLIGRLGYISYIGGLLMGFCTVTGYKLFGKKFDIFGIISCIIVIALAVLASNIFIETWSIFSDESAAEVVQFLGYNGFADVFFNFFGFVGTLEDTMHQLYVETGNAAYNISIMSEIIKDLVIGYLFSGVGFLVVGIPAFKARND